MVPKARPLICPIRRACRLLWLTWYRPLRRIAHIGLTSCCRSLWSGLWSPLGSGDPNLGFDLVSVFHLRYQASIHGRIDGAADLPA